MFDSEIQLVPVSELPDYVQKYPGKFKHMLDTQDVPV